MNEKNDYTFEEIIKHAGPYKALMTERNLLAGVLKLAKQIPELNPNNYTHEDVCAQNENVVAVLLAVRTALAIAGE